MCIRHLLAAVILALAASTAAAQAPHREHLTLRTEHFAIHFTRELEPLARHAAVHAERAYAALAKELVPPRGTIDLVVSDNVDYANGYATTAPTNRIVVYAHPPVDSPALRYNGDWMQLVITHELAHVFHLDRSRGMWRGLQYVFGRNPLLFPNNYSPRWLSEGLATYYESRLTGAGRVKGSFHRELAMASAREGTLPRLDEISVATPVFPGGQSVYVYGSLFLDHLARTRGADKVRAVVERTAVHPFPFILNRVSRHAFGVSYRDAWREFTDSLDRAAGAFEPPFHDWRDLTPASLAAEFLRWNADGTLTYTGTAPRERYGAWEIRPDGTRRFLGRRNGATPNVRLADGSLLYAQPDYVDPYTFRSDLYLENDGRRTRLTRGARLSAPDARTDGRIVAVQAVPGGSRLVFVDLEERNVVPFTEGDRQTYWAEPRWSPDGRTIVSVRWLAGTSTLVLHDADGTMLKELASSPHIVSAPAWTADGRAVIFASDRQWVSDLYVVDIGSAEPRIVAGTRTSLFFPALSPDMTQLAAVRLGGGGFLVGSVPMREEYLGHGFTWHAPPPPPPVSLSAEPGGPPATPYSAVRQLLPRLWMPVAMGNEDDTRIGFYTYGNDILQRHGWEAELAFPVQGHGIEGAFSYTYAGLARPLLSASVAQFYDLRGDVFADTTFREEVAHIDRRVRSAALSATFVRPRVRSNLSFVVAAGADWRANVVHPDLALDVDPAFFADSLMPRATTGLAYSRVQSTPYAISPEDGFTLALSATNRWLGGFTGHASQVVTGIATGYRSLPLPGYARHVAALRLAGGWTDDRSPSELQVGGVSGAALPIAFGLASIGEGRRTFPVRGFPSAALRGTRAWTASAEYRAPLLLLARGAGLLPFFVERTSLAAFADAGSAWCPTFVRTLCYEGVPRTTIGSVGGEARVNLTFGSWDTPFQLRGGVAAPVLERGRARDDVTFYLTTGVAF